MRHARARAIPREALSHLLVCVCPADSAVHVVHVVTSVFDGSELVQTHMLARHPAAVLALGRPPGGVTLMPKIRALSCGLVYCLVLNPAWTRLGIVNRDREKEKNLASCCVPPLAAGGLAKPTALLVAYSSTWRCSSQAPFHARPTEPGPSPRC